MNRIWMARGSLLRYSDGVVSRWCHQHRPVHQKDPTAPLRRHWNSTLAAPVANEDRHIETSHASVSVPFRRSQEGTATLVAHVSQNATTRVQISHKSPCRWIPMKSSNSTTAMVALGHYGGGMADGDSATVDITVQAGAFVRCTSQGTNRIYKKRLGEEDTIPPSRMETTVRCEANATCWMTPDPTQLQTSARFHQDMRYELQSTSSLVAVDWICAGRLTAGERWDHELCRLRTTVSIDGKVHFIDALDLPPQFHGMDWKDVQIQTFGTVVLYNVPSEVVDRFRQLQRDMCAKYTATRSGPVQPTSSFGAALSGRILIGMNSEEYSDVLVVRFAAESNEDVYRTLHWAMGTEHGVYGERIRAVRSAPPVHVVRDTPRPAATKLTRMAKAFSTSSAGVLLMADSMFPIGSFAHSFGLETAAQLGLIHSKQQVIHYLQATLLSNVQQSVPLIRFSARNPSQLHMANVYAECLLSSNPPAYRASTEQAKNLCRIMEALRDGLPIETAGNEESVMHFAPLWAQAAIETFELGEEEACQAFSYAVARDLVSAAVRMNLLGPLEGQAVLWKDLLPLLPELGCMDFSLVPRLDDAATCSPSLDAIQPCHDLLATRLFRS